MWLINFEISEPDVELKEVLNRPAKRAGSPPPSSSNSPSHPPHLEQHHQPPPTCSCPPPYFFFFYTNLRSLSHPVENQHVAPGHKSGLCEVDLQCLMFTSSSFSPLCHSAPPPDLFSSLPRLLTNWLPILSLIGSKHSGCFFFTDLLNLCPESGTRHESWINLCAQTLRKSRYYS